MLAQIHVTFKDGVLDPQGKTVHHALNDLGYDEVLDVNIGKYMERLLANTVIESFRFTLVPTD
jgi:phosphoribosylformylglycinamidine synthase PurS subunit